MESQQLAVPGFPRPGAGKVPLPFAQGYATGDTDAFHSAGRVAVEVKDFNGGSTCNLQLHDAADGQVVDSGTAHKGAGPMLLDPGGRSQGKGEYPLLSTFNI